MYSRLIFAVILSVHLILSFLLFDPSILLMADDANYILGAKRFLEDGAFPLAHGATLYHLVLAIPFALFGKTILVGKVCSVLWSTVTLVLCYYTFRKVVSLWVLSGVLLIQSSNFLIHFYGSSNMSEAFYMMVQMILIAVVFYYHDGLISTLQKNKESIRTFLLICIPVVITSFLVSISKSLGIVAPISIVVYLLIRKKWANGAVFFSLFVFLKFAYELGVKSIYGIERLSNRIDVILLKDTYHPEQGYENISGLFWRTWENFNYHISCDFLRILGWRENTSYIEPIAAFSLLFLLLFFLVLWQNWKQRSRMLFTGTYLLVLASVTFLSLQANWKQDRMILIMIPLILIFLLDGAHEYLKKRAAKIVPAIYVAIAILAFANLNHLGGAIARSRGIFKEYQKGNEFYAYTPDWQNYLGAVRWADENLGETSVVLCRKGNTASVYSAGNIKFLGRSLNAPKNGAVALKELQQEGVTHILLANLRINPNQAVPGMVIGTIHSYVQAIAQYDAKALKPLYSTKNREPAYIFELDYSTLNVDSD